MTLSPLAHINLMQPESKMGHKVYRLVSQCPPLDPNSLYCNILQCDHFAQTSCAAINKEGELVGFVSGYIPPASEGRTLFIWQVAVAGSQRGKNLGMRMMQDILAREVCQGVRFLETTVTESNQASCAMFEKLAVTLQAKPIEKKIIYHKKDHFDDQHDSEVLFRIGPFRH